MFVFPGSRPKGKPNLVLDLRGGRIEEHKSKKHFYCLKVTASHREVRLAFETSLEQSRWLERAAKVNDDVSSFWPWPTLNLWNRDIADIILYLSYIDEWGGVGVGRGRSPLLFVHY